MAQSTPTTYNGIGVPIIQPPIAKTADYALGAKDAGGFFTNRGATGTVIFSLPGPTTVPAGTFYDFYGMVAYTLTISAVTALMVTFNNAAATSISFQTSSELIGGGARLVNDGTSWLAILLVGEAQTVTVA
jgi:hypothetical protein